MARIADQPACALVALSAMLASACGDADSDPADLGSDALVEASSHHATVAPNGTSHVAPNEITSAAGANAASTCGNGHSEDLELCDGSDLAGETCATVTMLARPVGTLACTERCTFNVSRCMSASGSRDRSGRAFGGGGASAFSPITADWQ